jgi:hypothetical protein
MKLTDVQRKNRERKEIQSTIRTTKSKREWMRERNISPQMVFDEALNEIIEQMRGKK